MLSSLVVSAAFSGYYFNNLLYKEWVANDDKDCSIIPIKLRRYWKKKSYRDKYYFVIIVNLICCFKNKDDDFIIVHLQAACVLDQVIQGSTHSSHWSQLSLFDATL